MTSVLYSSGLNYQAGNPIRTEINKLTNSISDLRKLVEGQSSELTKLREHVVRLEAMRLVSGAEHVTKARTRSGSDDS